ncbi:class I SAM-dependent methyltransferase [Geomonas agri]|uniref:class I SAM-dependent methyltransferase n=1 Tax=Geomonas agri TaxID=2873702 RepID=UPI001CD626A8|nr:class I SAM-dependent methyltransferase [Geomonas agri]
MMADLKIQQRIQEEEYLFPYHYIGQYRDGTFRHFLLDTWAVNYCSTIEYLIAKIGEGGRAGRIVDIGCGDGRFSRELSLALPGSRVVGIDYSSRAVALAAAMNADAANLEFLCEEITGEHGLKPFDAAVLMEVLEHIPQDAVAAFIASVRGLLKRSGVLYLTVPHLNKPLEEKHFQHFCVESLCRHLEPHFEVVETVPFERMSPLRDLLLWTLSNRFFILNHPGLLSALYRWYKSVLFHCTGEEECQRIFVRAVAK